MQILDSIKSKYKTTIYDEGHRKEFKRLENHNLPLTNEIPALFLNLRTHPGPNQTTVGFNHCLITLSLQT